MRLIGILIAVVIFSLFIVWWLNMTLNSTKTAVTTTQSLEGTSETQNIQGPGVIDYSKEKADEINQMTEERAKEYEAY